MPVASTHCVMAYNLQQALIIGGINCISFSNGFILGQMAGLVRALKQREDGVSLTDGEISIIASSVMLICICGLGLAAFISDIIGRRSSFIAFSIPSTLSWIVLYYARDMWTFMLSRVLAGIALGGLFALKICTTSEYSSPRRRALFLNFISTLAPSVGSGLGHALGIVLHWRTLTLLGLIPSSVGVILPLFWVESPHWLASKGRFEECEIAFRKLHGNTVTSESELQLLIKVEKTKLKKAEETNSIPTYKKLLSAFRRLYFWELMLLSVFINSYLAAAGKLSFNTLAITIIEDISGSSNVLFFTVIVDGFIIAGACTSCYLISKMSMRNMLFRTGFIANSLLVSLSACLYFRSDSVYFSWANAFLLAFYFFSIKAGPYPVLEALIGEIYPLEVKVYCFFFSGIILMSSLSLTIVLLPILVNSVGYHGLFLINAGIMTLSLFCIWLRLPETKGRTLQEIEIYFKTKTFNKIDEALNGDQMKALI